MTQPTTTQHKRKEDPRKIEWRVPVFGLTDHILGITQGQC
jgi:hypothetical protein